MCRNDHYYLASSACNTMATEGKCDHEMCSSSWQTQKHSPSRTWSKQTHLPNGVELIGVPCSGFITHFNALPHFPPSFWQLNVILQSLVWVTYYSGELSEIKFPSDIIKEELSPILRHCKTDGGYFYLIMSAYTFLTDWPREVNIFYSFPDKCYWNTYAFKASLRETHFS